MRILRQISRNTRTDGIRNKEIHLKIRVAPIDDKMRALEMIWPCSKVIASKKKSELIQIKRKRPKRTLVKVIKNDMSINKVTKSTILDRIEWRRRMHVANSN